jgi:hypothetical protein
MLITRSQLHHLAKVNDGANQFNPAAEILVILISG